MSPNDPTPESAPDEPAIDGDELEGGEDTAAPAPFGGSERQPPGPDDVPISNLPPPSDAIPVPTERDVLDEVAEELGEPQEPAAVEPELHEGVAALIEDEPWPHDEAVAPEEAEVVDEAEADLDDRAVAYLDEPAEATVAPVAPVARRPRSARARITLIAVIVAVAASALALTKAQQVGDLTAQRDDRRAIERVSSQFGSAYLSFNFEHADVSARAVRALATPSFAASYTAQSAPGIQELFSSRQTTTKATTTAVYIGIVASGSARALVVVDVTATSPSEGQQRLADVSFVLDLDRTDDGWRVDNVVRAPQPSLDAGTPPG